MASHFDAATYARNARFVAAGGRALVALLDPQPGERVLDVGCGDGVLAVELAAAGATVVGIDASPSLVAAARALGVDARVCDARALPFDGEFDGALTNAAMHWMGPAPPVLRGVRRALRAGGRFVGELGGAGNVRALRAALHAALAARGYDPVARDPWTFPTADAFASDLARAGFDVLACETFARPTPLPTGVAGWLATFDGPFVAGMRDAERDAIRAQVVAALGLAAGDDASEPYVADYVRLRFVAIARA